MLYKALAISALSLFAFCGAFADDAEEAVLPETQEEVLAACSCKKNKNQTVNETAEEKMACSSCRGKMQTSTLELNEQGSLARALTSDEEDMIEDDIDFDDLMACSECGCGCGTQTVGEIVQEEQSA